MPLELHNYLKRYVVKKSQSEVEKIPNFYEEILNKLISKETGGLLYFIDKTNASLPLISFFFSLFKFSNNLPTLINEFSALNLEIGDKVRVLPDGWVFEFAGSHPKYKDDFFIVKVLNEPGSTRTIPKVDFLRFEKTTKERPKGKLSGGFTDLEPTSLDFFLPGMSTFGNDDILEIQTLILGKKLRLQSNFSSFSAKPKEEFCEYPELVNQFHTFSDISPLGVINESGEIFSHDRSAGERKPLIASSHSINNLFTSLRENKLTNKLILIDGASYKDIDPYYMDYALEYNLVCIVASREELFSSHSFKGKFEIVIPQEDEVLKESINHSFSKKSSLNKAMKMASNRKNLKIYFHFSTWIELEDICLLYTSPSPRDRTRSRMPSSA